MNQMPTAHQVAVAIVTAAREMGTDPFAIATGASGRTHPATGRARYYAAMAINRLFECSEVACARMVGAPSPTSYLGALKFQLRHGEAQWWRPDTLDRVVAAVQATIERPKAEPIMVQPARPAVSSRQVSARRMLEEAVANTARMQKN